MNRNLRPKTLFLTDAAAVRAHTEVITNGRVQYALDLALLEMQRILGAGNPAPVDTAAAMHWQMQGALLFVDIFKNLAEAPTTPPKPPKHELTG